MGTGAEGVHRREESKVFQGTKDVLSPTGSRERVRRGHTVVCCRAGDNTQGWIWRTRGRVKI